jgi:hypothetical protein
VTQTEHDQTMQPDVVRNDWKGILRGGGIAAFLQLACVMITMIVIFTIGGEPTTAAEYFSVLENDKLIGLIRMDIPSIATVALYTLTLFGLYGAFKNQYPGSMALATCLGIGGALLWLGSHSLLSMLSLSDQFAAATNEIQRSQLLAAGEAVIASDMWHSTGSFVSGIFLQGSTTLISILMLKSSVFNKTTAWVGILAHGIDLLHVPLMVFIPAIGAVLMAIAGPLYPIWFFLVGRKLLQLAGSPQNNNISH